MSTLGQDQSRFLPTLTEVVQQSDLGLAKTELTPDLEAIVQSVMRRLAGEIERRLAEELEPVVREAVAQEIAALTHQLKVK